jgi:arabinofuranan 3-O-arabinosyltransferase
VRIPGRASAARSQSNARAVLLPCGAGPVLQLDGTVYQTQVITTVQKLRELTTIPLIVCGSTKVTQTAGQHRLRLISNDAFSATSVTLAQPAAISAVAASAHDQVTTTVASWGAVHRVLTVAARRQPSLITVDENANAGWHAAADGHRLTSVTVDGWKQGYVLPAGPAAVVTLTFAPQSTYSVGLVGGAAAVLVLLVALCVPARSRRRWAPAREIADSGLLSAVFAVGFGWLCGARAGLLIGVLVAVGAAVARLVVRRRGWRHADAVLGGLAVVVFAMAGAILVRRPWGNAHYAGNTAPVQVLCLLAVALTLTAPVLTAQRRVRARPAPEPPEDAAPASPEPVGAGASAASPPTETSAPTAE